MWSKYYVNFMLRQKLVKTNKTLHQVCLRHAALCQSSFESFSSWGSPISLLCLSSLILFCAGKWLSGVKPLILLAEMFNIFIGDCANIPGKYRIFLLLWSSFSLCDMLATKYMSCVEQSSSRCLPGAFGVCWSETSLCPLGMKRRFDTLLL